MSYPIKYRAVDFFCGGGGMTYGLRQAGINVIAGVDLDADARETYEINNPGTKFINADITKLPLTYCHYRYLHSVVKNISKNYYQKKDCYNSIEKFVKMYVSEVQKKAVLNETDTDLMNKAFGMSDKTKEKLRVTAKYKKTDGTNFNLATIENIEEAQKWLSVGLMKGVRNPLAHEEKKELQESGLLTDIDALDYLSLLSHLFKRLENSLKENSK